MENFALWKTQALYFSTSLWKTAVEKCGPGLISCLTPVPGRGKRPKIRFPIPESCGKLLRKPISLSTAGSFPRTPCEKTRKEIPESEKGRRSCHRLSRTRDGTGRGEVFPASRPRSTRKASAEREKRMPPFSEKQLSTSPTRREPEALPTDLKMPSRTADDLTYPFHGIFPGKFSGASGWIFRRIRGRRNGRKWKR